VGRVHEHWADTDRLNIHNGGNLVSAEEDFARNGAPARRRSSSGTSAREEPWHRARISSRRDRARDFDETIRFYTEGLGFRVHFPFSVPGRIDRAAFLDAGDGRFVEVFGDGSIVQAEGRRRFPNEERLEGALLHFCLRVADTDASYARALVAGAMSRVDRERDGERRSPGRVRIAFRDRAERGSDRVHAERADVGRADVGAGTAAFCPTPAPGLVSGVTRAARFHPASSRALLFFLYPQEALYVKIEVARGRSSNPIICDIAPWPR